MPYDGNPTARALDTAGDGRDVTFIVCDAHLVLIAFGRLFIDDWLSMLFLAPDVGIGKAIMEANKFTWARFITLSCAYKTRDAYVRHK